MDKEQGTEDVEWNGLWKGKSNSLTDWGEQWTDRELKKTKSVLKQIVVQVHYFLAKDIQVGLLIETWTWPSLEPVKSWAGCTGNNDAKGSWDDCCGRMSWNRHHHI